MKIELVSRFLSSHSNSSMSERERFLGNFSLLVQFGVLERLINQFFFPLRVFAFAVSYRLQISNGRKLRRSSALVLMCGWFSSNIRLTSLSLVGFPDSALLCWFVSSTLSSRRVSSVVACSRARESEHGECVELNQRDTTQLLQLIIDWSVASARNTLRLSIQQAPTWLLLSFGWCVRS